MSSDQSDQAPPTDTADHRSASAMLRTWARATPDVPMLTEGSTTLTWSEVFDRANRVSHALAEKECRPATGWPSWTGTASSTSRSSSAAHCSAR